MNTTTNLFKCQVLGTSFLRHNLLFCDFLIVYYVPIFLKSTLLDKIKDLLIVWDRVVTKKKTGRAHHPPGRDIKCHFSADRAVSGLRSTVRVLVAVSKKNTETQPVNCAS